MAVIYLKHPIHGSKVATMDLEAANDEQNGWVRYTYDTPSLSEAAAPVNELEVKRRGRPPKTQMQGA